MAENFPPSRLKISQEIDMILLGMTRATVKCVQIVSIAKELVSEDPPGQFLGAGVNYLVRYLKYCK